MKSLILLQLWAVLQVYCQFTITPDLEFISMTNTTNTVTPNIGNPKLNIQSQDVVKCACDLTHALCDFKCCCDKQCPSINITYWQNNGVCLDKKIIETTSEFPRCDVLGTNPFDSKIYFNQVNRLNCLFFENVPYHGEFLNEITSDLSSTVNLTNFYAIEYQNAVISQTVLNSSYKPGDNLISNDGSQILIINPDIFGYCQDYSNIVFLVNSPKKTCTTKLSTCPSDSSFLSIQYYSSKQIQFNSAQINIAIDNIQNVNFSQAIDICECQNVLQSIKWKFNIDSNNTIISVNISATYQNITINCPNSTLQTSTSASLSQQVVWLQQNDITLEPIYRSGEPGYKAQYPILIGYKTQNNDPTPKAYVNQFKQFLIYGSKYVDGTCMTTTEYTDAKTAGNLSSLGQGIEPLFNKVQDMSCQIYLNQSEYNSLCSDSSGTKKYQVFNNFNSSIMFGQFGNANLHYIKDWIQITNINNTDIKQLPTANQTCKAPAIQVLTFFYSKAGVLGNLQNYLIRAQIQDIPNIIWTWNEAGSQYQLFSLQLRLNYIELSQSQLVSVIDTQSNTIDSYINGAFYPFSESKSELIRAITVILFIIFLLL